MQPDWTVTIWISLMTFFVGVVCGCWLCGGITAAVAAGRPDEQDDPDDERETGRYRYAPPKKYPMH